MTPRPLAARSGLPRVLLAAALFFGAATFAPSEVLADPGRTTFVVWGDQFWDATIVEHHRGGGARVHYDGWGEEWDEDVEPERLGHRALAGAPHVSGEQGAYQRVVAIHPGPGDKLFVSSDGETFRLVRARDVVHIAPDR